MAKKIVIELIIPDDFEGGGDTLLYTARKEWHEAFRGSQDYIDSNVVVWDNRNASILDTSFTETGLIVDFGKCRDKSDADTRLRAAIANMFGADAYDAMVCGIVDDVSDDADDEDEDESPIPHLLGHYQA